MSRDFFLVSSIVSTVSPLVPLFIYWRTRRLQEANIIYLVLLLIISLFADTAGIINSLYFKMKYVNETASYIYYFSATLLICLFYQTLFPETAKKYFTFAIIGFFMVYFYWLLTNPTIITRHESKVPVGILFTILSISSFYSLIKKMPAIYIQRIPMFWINSGFLIYSSGTLILFIISSYLFYVLRKDLLEYWIFHNLLNTICHLLIAIGLSKVRLKHTYTR